MQEPSPAGDVDYSVHGAGYVTQRRTDPRIEAYVHAALGTARTVLNVGAGAGSYEPEDRYVLAIEPAAAMRAQRPAHRAPAIRAVAEELPLDDRSVDASMAMATVHQWRDCEGGLRELRRVTRGPVLVLTWDGEALRRFWLSAYAPEIIASESARCPEIRRIEQALGGRTRVETIPIPHDCVDGFVEAYYARPEALLDPAVRRSQSAWTFVSPEVQERSADALARDLRTGQWDRRFGELRTLPAYEGSLRLIVSEPI